MYITTRASCTGASGVLALEDWSKCTICTSALHEGYTYFLHKLSERITATKKEGETTIQFKCCGLGLLGEYVRMYTSSVALSFSVPKRGTEIDENLLCQNMSITWCQKIGLMFAFQPRLPHLISKVKNKYGTMNARWTANTYQIEQYVGVIVCQVFCSYAHFNAFIERRSLVSGQDSWLTDHLSSSVIGIILANRRKLVLTVFCVGRRGDYYSTQVMWPWSYYIYLRMRPD